jgi:parvulin-like peptidyl-prolyl isomerase
VASPIRIISALGAFFVLALMLVACGGVPGNGVAKVDDSVIKKSTFDHWIGVAALSSQSPGSTGGAVVPDAPKYTKCIAAKRVQQPKPAAGQPQQTDAQLKAACDQDYKSLQQQVMQFLISAQWIQGEAKDLGIHVTDADVQKEFQKQKQQSFPKEADYQAFLKSSGMSQADILLRVKLDLLSNKIRDKVTKGKGKVTEQQIAAYYSSNKSRFGQPQRRDLLVVLTKDQATANKAKAALASGQSFAAVAKKYSIDDASKAQGGKLTVSKGQQEAALDAAVFAAKPGAVVGPVKTQFGYYVFKVTKNTPGTQQTLDQARASIKSLLTTQNQQKALQDFVKKFQKKWKGRTDCRKGYVVQTCSNAPKQSTTSTGAPGAVPQQGGAQQTPQSGGAQQVPQQGAQQTPQSGGAQQVPAQP